MLNFVWSFLSASPLLKEIIEYLPSIGRWLIKRSVHKNVVRITAMMLAFVLAGDYAKAAEPTMLTLSCDGKVTDTKATDAKSEPVNKIGVVVNLTDRTVSFLGYVAQIDSIDAADVTFSGETKVKMGGQSTGVGVYVMGDIDRVTGAMSAATMSTASTHSYELVCKVANRLF